MAFRKLEETRTETIMSRVTKSEYSKIQVACKKLKLSTSSLIQKALNQLIQEIK